MVFNSGVTYKGLTHRVVLGWGKFNLLRRNDEKPSKIDDDFAEISVLSYEDTEFEFTLFGLDIVNLGKICTLILR